MRHGMTTSGLFQQGQAHSPSFFSVARAMGRHADDLADFCIPCNPYFPTDGMFAELERNLRTILKFYPSDAAAITAQLASVLRLNPSTISPANGSTELITWIDRLLVDASVAVPIPTFGRWTDQPMETGKRVDMFLLKEADNFELHVDEYVDFIRRRGSRVAVLCNPNNPDGGYLPRREVIRFMDALEDLDLVVIDESFVDFVEVERNPSVAAEAVVRPNVIVLKSLGKNFGLHGIRFGYQVSNPAMTRKLSAALPKWNLNSLAETVIFMLAEHRAEYEESLKKLALDRFVMNAQLSQFAELTVYPSQANFLLVKLPASVDGAELCDHLLTEHHLLVRQCGNKIGMTSQFIRLGVRPDTEVDRLVEGLRGVERLGGGRPSTPAIELVSHAREPERSIS
ncbi:pyridoxal phosphate-dependent aminotransferase [Amycolatopsis vancoresmycina]|uniref:Putative aminotransferase n=1 Tax=Amycolatopsis vancoresmycina DSM 44592 TaxID=1292037 RepID=R1G2R2_9PSEU|nr:histidinol-phosphate transaminase [Amycolatopsis vancoresmycina]EOD65793.1 putative aminotransferase [Amycolatopsis vancoresmycina DSM 44592]